MWGVGFLFSRLTTCASRLTIEDTGFCLKAFSLRSLGAVCNAGPLTSRPGGPVLKRWVRAEFISVGWDEVAFEPTLYILGERGYTSKDKVEKVYSKSTIKRNLLLRVEVCARFKITLQQEVSNG